MVYEYTPQIHPKTGEHRTTKRQIYGTREPLSKFDSRGYYNGEIPPHTEEDEVINEERESDVNIEHVFIDNEE